MAFPAESGTPRSPFHARYRADLPWADVVIDGVNEDPANPAMPIPERLPDPRDVFRIPMFGYDARISGHVLTSGQCGAIAVRIQDDTHRSVGFVLGPLGDMMIEEDDIWAHYTRTPRDGISRLFGRLDAWAHIDPSDHETASRNALLGLIDAVEDPAAWLGGHRKKTVDRNLLGSVEVAREFIVLASLGFGDYPTGTETVAAFPGERSEFVDIRLGGFDPNNKDDMRWVNDAASRGWQFQHPHWGDLFALREEAWSLPALEILHEHAVAGGATWSTPLQEWMELSTAQAWLNLVEIPEYACECIEAGLDLSEAPKAIWTDDGFLDLQSMMLQAASLRGR